MALWSKLIPELLSNGYGKSIPFSNEEEEDREIGIIGGGGFRSVLPLSTLNNINVVVSKSHDNSLTTDSSSPDIAPDSSSSSSSSSPPHLMGAQPEVDQRSTTHSFHILPSLGPANNGGNGSTNSSSDVEQSGGIALSIVIVIGICFLVLNVCACAGVFYQRDRVRFKEMLLQRQYKLRPANLNTGTASNAQATGGAGHASLASRRIDEDEIEGLAGMHSGLPHQASTSTMDPHTKVSQWIAQEISVEHCPTPPPQSDQQERNRLNKPTTSKLGGSDRYDPRDCKVDDPTSLLFPQLTKSSKASDIYGLVPVKEESGQVAQPKTSQKGHQKGTQSVESSLPFADASSSALTATRSTTGRHRKPRSKSQLSLQRSITKRDVAVGDDDFDQELGNSSYRIIPNNNDGGPMSAVFSEDERNRSSAYGYGTMDTIRRLNLPKVLPDLPHQDAPTDPLAPIYTTPYSPETTTNKRQSIDFDAKQRSCHYPGSESRADSVVYDRSNPVACGSSSIVKTNLPQTLVLAPRPRATGPNKATKPTSLSSSHYNAPEPEPCLVIRPGPRSHHPPGTTGEVDPATKSDVVVLRRSNQRDASTGSSRPASRNSRSWYAQYSQSFISQSIDQESDTNET